MYPDHPAGISLFFYDDQERDYEYDLERISRSLGKVDFDCSRKYVASSPKVRTYFLHLSET